jgi:hypothetical protein
MADHPDPPTTILPDATPSDRPEDRDRLILHSFPDGSSTALCGARLVQFTGRPVTDHNLEELECPICRARERARRAR